MSETEAIGIGRRAEGEYARRLGQREQQLTEMKALHRRFWGYFAASAIACFAVAFISLWSRSVSLEWALLPAVLAISTVRSLAKNAQAHARVQRMVRFYELGLARLSGGWQGKGDGGEEFLPERHLYASDLDLFGTGSLFELLCTARSGVGRAMLANWLLNPALPGRVRQRQAAVEELRDKLDLREQWASVGDIGLNHLGSAEVIEWANSPAIDFPIYAQAFAMGLPICTIVLLLLAHAGSVSGYWPWAVGIAIALQTLVGALLLDKTRRSTANLVLPSFEIAVLAPLLERLEGEQFRTPLLKSLQSRLKDRSGGSSKRIRTLGALVWLLDLRQSEYFALPSSLLLWKTNLSILIERWRQRNTEEVKYWLESLGEFEALLCFAGFYYENPEHTFAILKPEPASFEAEGLGHPLLPRDSCVTCDLRLDAQGRQLIMASGSNMSGKSTLLRSVGVNCVLAMAGAPVRAARLELSSMQVGCSITVQDSLVHGKSRFQAEVERLKSIISLSNHGNVLFLLDEILGGTNSSDRTIGARAVIGQLLERGAIGLVTTHDLALTDIVSACNGGAVNIHFEEQFEAGEMCFDYRARPGVLVRTNGANVMAALGLT